MCNALLYQFAFFRHTHPLLNSPPHNNQMAVLIGHTPLCIHLAPCLTVWAVLCVCVPPLVYAAEWLQEEDIVAIVREFCSCWTTLEAVLPALQKVFTTGKCDDGEISVRVRKQLSLLTLVLILHCMHI